MIRRLHRLRRFLFRTLHAGGAFEAIFTFPESRFQEPQFFAPGRYQTPIKIYLILARNLSALSNLRILFMPLEL
jgi:hypothetical protein